MEKRIRDWDGETVIVRHDRPTGAWIFIAIHSTRLGPATGGTRMKHYPGTGEALEDALRLAAGMTFKFAVPGVARGGGKAVISLPKAFEEKTRPDLLRRYGSLVRQLGGLFYTGPDVGTSSQDMDVISETGAPYVFCRTPEAGGAGSSGPVTALGVFTGIQSACGHAFKKASLKGRRVLVQGAGSVGGKLISLLLEAGAEVMFSEVDDRRIRHFQKTLGLPFVLPDQVYTQKCDVFSPCALGGVLNAESIAGLRCRVIAGGANNQLAEAADAKRLRDRGILYAPDYVVNLGGALAIPGIETLGWSREEAEQRVVECIRSALSRIFEMSETEGITTDEAARRIAEAHLA